MNYVIFNPTDYWNKKGEEKEEEKKGGRSK